MSGVMAEVVRLGGTFLDGAGSLLDAPVLEGPLPVASAALLLVAAGAALAWRAPGVAWPANDAAASIPGGWAADGAMSGAAGASAGGVLDVATPGGGE